MKATIGLGNTFGYPLTLIKKFAQGGLEFVVAWNNNKEHSNNLISPFL